LNRVGDRLGNLGGSFGSGLRFDLSFVSHYISSEFAALHNMHCAAPFQEGFCAVQQPIA
jgi:hypothetical protein